VEQAIAALNVPAVTKKIKHFHQAKCHKAKNILASSILDDDINHCTNSA
jgi:hypothetical protein